MRKAYGPTDVSYYLPLDLFTKMIRSSRARLAIGSVKDKIITVEIPQDLDDESIERIYQDADCVCYRDGIEMIIPSHLA